MSSLQATNLDANTQHTNDLISQIYIMHQTGPLLANRIYNKSCIVGDSQLIGGFISSLVYFFNDISSKCYDKETQGHQLEEISISCSRLSV
ncbi:MAG: hypothetical protein ACXAD7_23770 [Candidatus Kariarchaeaceae archaeon]